MGGSPEPSTPELLNRLVSYADKVVACDAGCAICQQAGVNIDIVVGDNDSVSDEALAYAHACGADFRTFPADKDETDLELALRVASDDRKQKVEKRAVRAEEYSVALTCVSGGRLDHMLAVLGTLCKATHLRPVIFEDSYSCLILKAPVSLVLDQLERTYPLVYEHLGGTFLNRTLSLVSLDGRARVSETGMKWDLDHVVLEPLSDLGVSNIVKREDALVELFGGTCALIILDEYVHKVR